MPDLSLTCLPLSVNQWAVPDPVLLIEILSPSEWRKTWSNVWTYVTTQSVREILIVDTDRIMVERLQRSADGSWPDRCEELTVPGLGGKKGSVFFFEKKNQKTFIHRS